MVTAVDVLVVGGGVNGCGIARDCALRGLKVALVEKDDFGAGASGASSGFIHGGMRYLLTNRSVTRASCLDAGYIRKIAPHLVRRVPIALPTKLGGLRGWWERRSIEAFFAAYDRFAPLKDGRPHVWLTAEDLRKLEPRLAPGLTGAAVTDEWWVDAPRLCWANAWSAKEAGADVRNHAKVEALLRDGQRVVGARLAGGDEIRAHLTVNAGGPWLDRIAGLAGATARIRPGKGVHVLLEELVSPVGWITEGIDGRWIFVIPAARGSLVGTTDTDFYGDPDDVHAVAEEVEYLLQGVERIFPSIRGFRATGTTAGLRPTLFQWGPSPDALSRAHRIFDHAEAPGLVTIAGGKLAAYRLMSAEVADLACAKLKWKSPGRTATTPLPGGESAAPDAADLLPPPVAAALARRHGARAGLVHGILRGSPALARVVCASAWVTAAEVVHAARAEMARSLFDLSRRTGLGLGACAGADCAAPAAELMAAELGWDTATRDRHVAEFLAGRARSRAALPAGKEAS